jgi:uncharacterized membrane protein
MSNLVVLGLDNRDDAEQVMDLAGDLVKQHLLELDDVAYASGCRTRSPSASGSGWSPSSCPRSGPIWPAPCRC